MKTFKTNAKCAHCVKTIAFQMDQLVPSEEWRIDLHSPDKLLYVPADTPDEQVVDALRRAGFHAERIGAPCACADPNDSDGAVAEPPTE